MNKVSLRGGFQESSWNEFKKGCVTAEQMFNQSIAPDEYFPKLNKKKINYTLPKLKKTILPRIDNKRPVNKLIVKSKVLNVEIRSIRYRLVICIPKDWGSADLERKNFHMYSILL